MQPKENVKKNAASTRTPIKVVIFGLGHIGRLVVEALESENPFWNQPLELVGVIDIVAQSRQWASKKGIKAYSSLKEMQERPDVCIHTTSSSFLGIMSQLEELAEAGIPTISSCEELFFPWVQNPGPAKKLDEFCKSKGVALIGTGVNPGFVMDVFPAFVTQVVHTVDKIRVERRVDAAKRRLPLQKKIGTGLSEKAFYELLEAKKIGHVGLMESMDYLAAYMGWELSKRGEKVEPVLAPRTFKTQVMTVKKGHVCGLKHKVWGEKDRKKVIELDLIMVLNEPEPADKILIQGHPSLQIAIENGTAGDIATVASLIRAIPMVLKAKPGIVRRLERTHFI